MISLARKAAKLIAAASVLHELYYVVGFVVHASVVPHTVVRTGWGGRASAKLLCMLVCEDGHSDTE